MDARFFTAGNATFTISRPDGHSTYRIDRKDASGSYPETYFVSLLTGSDNENDYRYLGILDPKSLQVRTTAKSVAGPDSLTVRGLNRVLARVRASDLAPVWAAGWDVRHAGKCCRCGQTLTNPRSLETGIGPECREKAGW